MIMKFLKSLLVVALASGVSVGASAQLVTEDVTDAITAVGVDITTVGVAIIGLAVIALAVRWVKATFF